MSETKRIHELEERIDVLERYQATLNVGFGYLHEAIRHLARHQTFGERRDIEEILERALSKKAVQAIPSNWAIIDADEDSVVGREMYRYEAEAYAEDLRRDGHRVYVKFSEEPTIFREPEPDAPSYAESEFKAAVEGPPEAEAVVEDIPQYGVEVLAAGNDTMFSDIEVALWAVVDQISDPEQAQIIQSVHTDVREATAAAAALNQGRSVARQPGRAPCIAISCAASIAPAAAVLTAPTGEDGRSRREWLRLADGGLALVIWPRGTLYEDLEEAVAADFETATAADELVYHWTYDLGTVAIENGRRPADYQEPM